MKYGTLAPMLIAGLLIGGTAQAQLLDTGIGAVGIDTRATTSVGDTSVSTDVNVDASMTASGTNSGLLDLGVDTSADSTLSFSFSKNAMDDGTTYATTEAHEVRSSAGLEAYAATTVRDDERVKEVTLEEGTLSFVYRLPARFLGFIPGSMTTTVSVDQQGDVTVDYPWYAFLMAKSQSSSKLEASISSEMGTTNNDTDVTATSTMRTGIQTGTDDVRYWAQVIESIHASLSANV